MRNRTFVVAVGACIALLALLAACGSSSDSTTSGGGDQAASKGCPAGVKDKLQARLAEYEALPKFEPPGPAFDASKAKGKKVFNIPLLSTDTFNQVVDKASAEAAKVAGLEFVQYNNEGDPAQWVAGMNQAISQKADLIILEGSPNPRALEPQLAAAKKAGIPVISTHFFDESIAQQQLDELPNLSAIVPANHYLASGTLTATYAMVHSDCNVNALVLEASEVQPTSPGITKRFKDELAANCPKTCKADTLSIPFGSWAQKASGEMQSRLNSDRSINYIAPNFDQGALYARSAILAAGADDRVKIVAYNGSAPVVQLLADKKSVIVEIGEPLVWLGWQNVDQALRILSGEEPTTKGTPLRMFDETNVSEAGSPVSQTEGYGPESVFKDGFKQLWGVG